MGVMIKLLRFVSRVSPVRIRPAFLMKRCEIKVTSIPKKTP